METNCESRPSSTVATQSLMLLNGDFLQQQSETFAERLMKDAGSDVNNRVKQVEPRLPEEVRRQGVTVQKGSSAFLQVLAFYSPDGRYDNLYISNYVTLNVLDALKRVPGTTNVQIFGAKDYAMRIWLRPDRLAQLRLSPEIGRAHV